MSINVETFYKLKTCGTHEFPDMKPFVADCQHRFLNDDDIYKIIFGSVEKTGLFPNTLELKDNPNLDPSIRSLISTINNKVAPVVPPAPDGVDPLDYVRSRYDQFPGDIDEFIEQLASDINSVASDINIQPPKSE